MNDDLYDVSNPEPKVNPNNGGVKPSMDGAQGWTMPSTAPMSHVVSNPAAYAPTNTVGYSAGANNYANGATTAYAQSANANYAGGASAGYSGNTNPPTPPRNASAASDSSKSPSLVKVFIVGFLGAALACILVLTVNGALGGKGITTTTTTLGGSGTTAITATSSEGALAEQVAQKCLPSVVSIDVYTQQSNSGYYGMFGGNNSSSSELTQSSLGSGVVISEDGYILTNYHVIEGAAALKVNVGSEQYDADIVGSDSSSDIAVVKITNANGATFTPIDLGDSDNLTIGEWVMSIGSPFGLEQSVATGIVSATNRSQVYSQSDSTYGYSTGETTIYTNLIQTDAAINPGNSGGALVNAQGQLIGINTLITSYSGNYSGVGFAIPVNYAINLAQQIIAGQTPSHAQLGVSTVTITSSIAQRYGFSVDAGAYVSSINAGSAAEAAGVQEGDIIVKADGKSIESASDLQLAVRSKNVGDKLSLTVNRDGKEISLEATLGSDASSSSTQNSLFNFGGGTQG